MRPAAAGRATLPRRVLQAGKLPWLCAWSWDRCVTTSIAELFARSAMYIFGRASQTKRLWQL